MNETPDSAAATYEDLLRQSPCPARSSNGRLMNATGNTFSVDFRSWVHCRPAVMGLIAEGFGKS